MEALEGSPVTVEYRHSLALAIHGISPALSALHAARSRLLYHGTASTSTTNLSCPRCGSIATPDRGHIRTRTKRPSTSAMAMKSVGLAVKFCYACGTTTRHVQSNTPYQKPTYPSVRSAAQNLHKRKLDDLPSVPVPSPSPAHKPNISLSPAPLPLAVPRGPPNPTIAPLYVSTSVPTSTPVIASKPKSRTSKKRSGLQEMLARNRTQKEKESKTKAEQESHSGGLATFLTGL